MNNISKLNTALLGIVLAISGWNLKTTVAIYGENAATAERLRNYDRELIDVRSRLIETERSLLELKLAIARIPTR